MEKIYQTLVSLPNLKPSPYVNKVFSALVSHVCGPYMKHTLRGGQVIKLRKMCSLGEYELEKDAALTMLSKNNPLSALQDFIYYKNYKDLVALEFVKSGTIKKISRVLFIGGGPLPLSVIILAKDYKVVCTVIDNNQEAIDISKKLIESLGLTSMVQVQYCDASEFNLYEKYDCIYVAALVGSTRKEKNSLISLIYSKMKNKNLLLCRSAHFNKKLLYPEIKHGDLPASPILEVRPNNHIINSFLVLQK